MSEPSHSSRAKPDREIELAASRWIGRRDAGMTPAETAELEAWRRADPRHERAFARHEATWRWFDRPAGAGQADELISALGRSGLRRRRRRQVTFAACLVAIVGLGVVWQRSRVSGPAPQIADTRAGGAVVVLPEKKTLPDGTLVEVKAGAEFVVEFTDEVRRVNLRQGEALFHVVKDPRRPFVVDAAGVAVRAVGTAFSVQFERDEIGVLVTEGRVAVETTPSATPAAVVPASAAPVVSPRADAMPEARLHLDAGQRTVVAPAAATRPQVETLSATEITARLAWRSPRLEFTSTPLQEAIELFNRYAAESGARRLMIEPADASLAQLEVSGYFRANNVAAFLHLISQTLGVTAEEKSDRITLRRTH